MDEEIRGKEIDWYFHRGEKVAVRKDLKGRHREFCLCSQCVRFNPYDRNKNCPIALLVYDLCVTEDLVLPVWECPRMHPKAEDAK